MSHTFLKKHLPSKFEVKVKVRLGGKSLAGFPSVKMRIFLFFANYICIKKANFLEFPLKSSSGLWSSWLRATICPQEGALSYCVYSAALLFLFFS